MFRIFQSIFRIIELALCWSGYEKCNIDFKKFSAFFESYIENTTLDMNIDWESIYMQIMEEQNGQNLILKDH